MLKNYKNLKFTRGRFVGKELTVARAVGEESAPELDADALAARIVATVESDLAAREYNLMNADAKRHLHTQWRKKIVALLEE